MPGTPRASFIRMAATGLVAAVFAALLPAAEAAMDPGSAWLAQERQAQFATLQRLIGEREKNRERMKVIGPQTFHPASLLLESDRDPADVALRRTEALLVHLKEMSGAPDLASAAAVLAKLKADAAGIAVSDSGARRSLFDAALVLRRKIALANPRLDFDRILFIKRPFLPGEEQFGNHMCQQYYGFYAPKVGSVFVLDKALTDAPQARDILAESVCETGRFKGVKLPPGGYLSPDLSYDGRTVLFSFTEADPQIFKWTEKTTFHVFKVNIDGSRLEQLTDGPVNDFDPCWLPGGRVAFISERRGGFGRCHPTPKPTYTLHSMNPDGSDIVCLSPHESNEWQPSVNHDGMVVYTRWDYVDRGAFQAHHPWITTPDGRDARALQGNYGKDWHNRPLMEMDVRAIPFSQRYVATAAAHHGQTYGPLVVIDPLVMDDDEMGSVKRLTPEVLFPESEEGGQPVYGTPWPLDETFYLCVYDAEATLARGAKNNFGIYLVDAFGNKELLYRDPALSCLSPIPLKARAAPPVVPHAVLAGRPASGGAAASAAAVPPENPTTPDEKTGTVGLINVYDSLKPWPVGTTIKSLRIMQVIPKTTFLAENPKIGHGFQKGARAVLGTVPVEADGSAHFRLPVGKAVYFQALDERGLAVQSMRSDTYVHPGQTLMCQGCHEPRTRAPATAAEVPLALRRPPSEIQPDVDGSNPFSYPRLVQPVLDKYCVDCHAKEPKSQSLAAGDASKNPNRWFTSYINMKGTAFFVDGFLWNEPRTVPGKFGARASKLLAILDKGHYDVKLPPEAFHRLTLWLDANSDFYGSYENTEAQARGEIVRPSLE